MSNDTEQLKPWQQEIEDQRTRIADYLDSIDAKVGLGARRGAGGRGRYSWTNPHVSTRNGATVYEVPRFETGEEADGLDLLHCLLSDLSCVVLFGTFDGFVDDFGIDIEDKDDEAAARRTWRAMRAEAAAMRALFTPGQLKTLQELFQDF